MNKISLRTNICIAFICGRTFAQTAEMLSIRDLVTSALQNDSITSCFYSNGVPGGYLVKECIDLTGDGQPEVLINKTAGTEYERFGSFGYRQRHEAALWTIYQKQSSGAYRQIGVVPTCIDGLWFIRETPDELILTSKSEDRFPDDIEPFYAYVSRIKKSKMAVTSTYEFYHGEIATLENIVELFGKAPSINGTNNMISVAEYLIDPNSRWGEYPGRRNLNDYLKTMPEAAANLIQGFSLEQAAVAIDKYFIGIGQPSNLAALVGARTNRINALNLAQHKSALAESSPSRSAGGAELAAPSNLSDQPSSLQREPKICVNDHLKRYFLSLAVVAGMLLVFIFAIRNRLLNDKESQRKPNGEPPKSSS